MIIPKFIQFAIHPSEEGGYTAEAIGFSIYTQGETVDETLRNIREAVECHFFEDNQERVSLPILANVEVPQLV